MERYLIWRFLRNNRNAYHKYCMEWIANLTDEQIMYFSEERERLIKMGIYNND
jgi:hypothetical protein